MMKRIPYRGFAALGFAVATGLCAAWAGRQYLEEKAQAIEHRARVPMADRIVAGHDLAPGTVLGMEHLAVRAFPQGLVSADSLAPDQIDGLLGLVLRAPVAGGDVLLPAYAHAPQPAPLSSRLAAGRRAITLPIDALNSQAGLLQPGDFIDLYVSFNHQRRRMTAPLLQGVRVLATGSVLAGNAMPNGLDDEASSYATITLDTAPEDAVKLVAARESGTLTALLRAPRDGAASALAARGDLAGLIGMRSTTPERKPSVIYGNQAVRTVPGLRQAQADTQNTQGIFQLPHAPAMASAIPFDAEAVHEAASGTVLSAEDSVGTSEGGP